jgi:hypothetical protein
MTNPSMKTPTTTSGPPGRKRSKAKCQEVKRPASTSDNVRYVKLAILRTKFARQGLCVGANFVTNTSQPSIFAWASVARRGLQKRDLFRSLLALEWWVAAGGKASNEMFGDRD